MAKKNKVTAYEVSGDVDYDKLVKEFGVSLIDDKLIKKSGLDSQLLKQKYFFAHRDFDKILDHHSKGNKFAIVSGRGPSSKMHLAHLLLYRFVKEIQDEYSCFLFFPFSDDEKYFYNPGLDFKTINDNAYENAYDVVALGFDPAKTEIMFDLKNLKQDVYNLSVKCAKRLTFNKVKAAFGFTPSHNVGITYYPAMQAAHILYPTEKYGLPTVVMVAIDQDVFIKLTRDVAHQLKLTKPAALLSRFMKGLGGNVKMSSSNAESAIYTTDDSKTIKKKIMNAITGGRVTVEEQRAKGANPDICSVYEYLRLFFLSEDKDIKQLTSDCKGGKLLCGQCKERLNGLTQDFLADHQKKREKAKKLLPKYFKDDKFVPKL